MHGRVYTSNSGRWFICLSAREKFWDRTARTHIYTLIIETRYILPICGNARFSNIPLLEDGQQQKADAHAHLCICVCGGRIWIINFNLILPIGRVSWRGFVVCVCSACERKCERTRISLFHWKTINEGTGDLSSHRRKDLARIFPSLSAPHRPFVERVIWIRTQHFRPTPDTIIGAAQWCMTLTETRILNLYII